MDGKLNSRTHSKSTSHASSSKMGAVKNNVLVRLLSTKQSLTPVLRKISETVLKDPARVVHQTITEVADSAGSSEASVLRLCRIVGFSSFQSFKLALGIEMQGSNFVDAPHPTGDVIEDCLSSGIASLRNTRDLLDRAALEKTALRIVQSKSIDITGLGGSAIAANYANFRFVLLGLSTRVFNDPHLAVMSAAALDSTRTAIGFSESGSTKDVIRTLEIAKKAGAFTVAVTCHLRSPIAAVADIVLAAASSETPLARGTLPTVVGQFMIVDILTGLITKSNAKFGRAIRHVSESTIDLSY